MIFFDIKFNVFGINFIFRIFFGEFYNVWMFRFGVYGLYKEINVIFRIMKNFFLVEKKIINFKEIIFYIFFLILILLKFYLIYIFLNILLFKFYYVFILDVDVMWWLWIVIGLFDFIGGLILIIIGVDVFFVVLLVKLVFKSFVVRIFNIYVIWSIVKIIIGVFLYF